MDPNLEKIRDANMHLVKRGKLGVPILQAKDYLIYILGEDKMDQVDREMDEFVDHLKALAKDAKKEYRKRKRRRDNGSQTEERQETTEASSQ